MMVRAIRGATDVRADTGPDIVAATSALLQRMIDENDVVAEDIISVIFTTTPDLAAEFPARAARDLGWNDVPLLGAVEMSAPHQIPRCVRILMHVYSHRSRAQVRHVYLGGARQLRPDLR